VAPTDPQGGDIKVEFAYDYMGRRIEKTVTEWDIGDPNTPGDDDWASTPTSHLRWMYYEWQPLMELNGASSNAPTKKYAWGLDLAGSGNHPKIDGVAGIGGLLAVRDVAQSKSFVYLYDGNGNVGQLVNLADGSTVAKYEYDAYGNVTASGGSYAATNVMRFSTKQRDDETDLGYWGYRYYESNSGRWVSRDPIGEGGGRALYSSCRNTPVTRLDTLGLLSLGPPTIPDPGDSGWNPFDDYSPPEWCGLDPGPPSPPSCDDGCCKSICENSNAGAATLCDGKGGACICNCLILRRGDIPPGEIQEVVENCASSHEDIHRQQFNAADGCKDQPACANPTLKKTPEHECDAYAEQFSCLTRDGNRTCFYSDDPEGCRSKICKAIRRTADNCIKSNQCASRPICARMRDLALVRAGCPDAPTGPLPRLELGKVHRNP